MRRKSAIFGLRHNDTKSFITNRHDAGIFGIAASRVVTRHHGISDRHGNLRAIARARPRLTDYSIALSCVAHAIASAASSQPSRARCLNRPAAARRSRPMIPASRKCISDDALTRLDAATAPRYCKGMGFIARVACWVGVVLLGAFAVGCAQVTEVGGGAGTRGVGNAQPEPVDADNRGLPASTDRSAFAKSGARVRALGYAAEDVAQFRTLHDRQLAFDCEFMNGATCGDLHCPRRCLSSSEPRSERRSSLAASTR
jgi:hypothetical protein